MGAGQDRVLALKPLSTARLAIVYLEPVARDLSSARSAVLEVAALARAFPACALVVAVDPRLAPGPFRMVVPDQVSVWTVEPAWGSGRELYGPRLIQHRRRIGAAIAAAAQQSDGFLVFDADAPSLIAAAAIRRSGRSLAVYLRGERGYERAARRRGVLERKVVRLLEQALHLATARWMRGARVIETAPGLARRVGISGPVHPWLPTYLERVPQLPQRARPGPLRVLSVGRVSAEKRVGDMVAAIGAAVADGTDVELTIVGDGPQLGEIRQRIADSPAAARIFARGFVSPGPDLDAAYRDASVFLVLSESEGVPKTAIEALAWGMAVIWTPVGGLPDLLGPTQAAHRVPVGSPQAVADVLATLAGDTARLTATARLAQTVAEQFLLDRQLETVRGFLAQKDELW